MRLFVALDLPGPLLDNLGQLMEDLRPAAPGLRWSPVSNLHVTTKFIGEWPEARMGELRTQLAAVRAAPIAIELRGLGWFPNPHRPRVFFVAVRAPESLAALAASTERALQPLGIALETRPYSPHLTLARVSPEADLRELRRRVASLRSDDFGRFEAAEFHLYRSRPGPGGSVYTRLETFPFQ